MAKKTKKSVYTHYELGIYNGVTFKLVIPSKNNSEKYPNYFIQFNGSEKHYNGVKSLYSKFLNLDKDLQTTQRLIDYCLPLINNEIIPNISSSSNSVDRLRLSDKVTKAINKFLNQQINLYNIGELVDISDYKDRNKKLNDYFGEILNDKILLADLSKDIWLEFRYHLLRSYNIKSNSTVNQYITYVKSFYNWLQHDQEVMVINHVMKLKRLDTSKQKPKYDFIELSTVNKFLDTLASDDRWLRLNIVCLLVFENAKRPIQAYRLQAKDIDLSNKTLSLHPKSRNKAREITVVSDELICLIRKIYCNTEQLGRKVEPNDFLLGGRNCFKKGGKEVSQGDIRDLQIIPFRTAFPKFKDLLVYSLKHTTITSVAQYDLALAQRMANHSNQSTTEIYDRKKKTSKAIPRKRLEEDFK